MTYSNKLVGKGKEIKSLYDRGISDSKIAEQMNVTRQAIQKHRKKHGLILKKENKYFNGNNYKLSGKEILIRKWNAQKISDAEISRRLGVQQTAVWRVRNILNLPAIKQTNFGQNEDPDFSFDVYNPKELMATEFGQVLIGTLMGDGCITKQGYLKLAHSEKQEKYLDYKVKKLKYFEFNRKKTGKRYSGFSNGGKQVIARTGRCPFLKHIRKEFYPNGKKIINFDYVKHLDIRGLLTWLWDDGSIVFNLKNYNYFCIRLCVKGFKKEEIKKTINIFKRKFNLDLVTLTKAKNIRFSKEDSRRLARLSLKYLPEGLKYKKERIKIILKTK